MPLTVPVPRRWPFLLLVAGLLAIAAGGTIAALEMSAPKFNVQSFD